MSDYLPTLPTDAVKDTETRNILEYLSRNFEIIQNKIDGIDVEGTTLSTLEGVFGRGATYSPTASSNTSDRSTAFDGLIQSITNSYIFRKLGEEIKVDLSKYSLDQFPAISSAVSTAATGITKESTTREDKDSALAAAVNRMWAKMGGSTAVIADAALAAVTPSAAAATKWDAVVSAVTDPNTGQINSASIVQELDTYANNANSTFNAIYSVRAQISTGGQTVVGGFGLAATSGAGSGQGPTIDFGVRADRFFIAGTSSTPSLATQLSGAYTNVPFIVTTSGETVSGVYYPPGVYIKSAFINDATITTAKIGNAAVKTLKIDGYAVTVPVFNTNNAVIPGVGWVSGTPPGTYPYQQVLAVVVTLSADDVPCWLYASTTGYLGYGTGWRYAETCLQIHGTVVSTGGGDSAWVNAAHSGAIYITSAGSYGAALNFMGQDSGVRLYNPAIFLMAVKR